MQKFHMLVDEQLYQRINTVGEDAGNTFSGRMTTLLRLAFKGIETELLKEGDHGSHWRRIGVKIGEIHLNLPDKTYRQLKKIHVDCNFYSMAQIARRVLKYALDLIEEVGFFNAVLEFENKRFDNFETRLERIGEDKKKIQLDYKMMLRTFFDRNYIPQAVEFP